MGTASVRVKPFLHPEYCKGCGRCVEACAHHCIEPGHEIHAGTGLVPVVLHLEDCTACGLCFEACPEPYGLEPLPPGVEAPLPPARKRLWHTDAPRPRPYPLPFPGSVWPLPGKKATTLVVKGTYASAIGALVAGCRHFFGYPITPSTEGAELMARLLPRLDGVFVQAVSEVATVNLMYGCGGAGLPAMTFTSSPGFSLMLEGISYMIGAEVPGVFVNVMRGGPGLGNIGPEQADVKLACRGLGHGNTHAIVLCPATPQEMLDFTREAFWLAFTYRNPVIILSDGYLGQMTGRVELPHTMIEPHVPEWAVYGDQEHRNNLISSIQLSEVDLEEHNRWLNEKYRLMVAREQRADLYRTDDAEILLVAANTPARMAKGAVWELRQRGVKAGLFRPQTLWPFPIDALKRLLPHVRHIVVVEASPGQIEDEMRLSLSHAEVSVPAIDRVQRYGGVLPSQAEIVEAVNGQMERRAS